MIFVTNTTRDGGETWKVESHHTCFGAYFFLHDEIAEHTKKLMGIDNIIALVISLASACYYAMRAFVSKINIKNLEAKFIRANYYDV